MSDDIYVLTKGYDLPEGYFATADAAKSAAGPSPEEWQDHLEGDWYRPEHRPRVIGREWVEVANTRLVSSTNSDFNEAVARDGGYWEDVTDPDDPWVIDARVTRHPVND